MYQYKTRQEKYLKRVSIPAMDFFMLTKSFPSIPLWSVAKIARVSEASMLLNTTRRNIPILIEYGIRTNVVQRTFPIQILKSFSWNLDHYLNKEAVS
jgi:hypothetical protein